MKLKLKYVPKTYVCSCCGEEKPEYEFYTQSYTGQRENQCKTCVNVKRSVKRHKAKHSKFISKEKQRTQTKKIMYFLHDWRDAMLHFGGRCAWCGKPEGRARRDKHERDHVVPISRGGATVRNNIVPSCAKCNRGRGSREWKEWFREQPFWTQEQENKIIKWIKEG